MERGHTYTRTSGLLDRIGPVGRFDEKKKKRRKMRALEDNYIHLPGSWIHIHNSFEKPGGHCINNERAYYFQSCQCKQIDVLAPPLTDFNVEVSQPKQCLHARSVGLPKQRGNNSPWIKRFFSWFTFSWTESKSLECLYSAVTVR